MVGVVGGCLVLFVSIVFLFVCFVCLCVGACCLIGWCVLVSLWCVVCIACLVRVSFLSSGCWPCLWVGGVGVGVGVWVGLVVCVTSCEGHVVDALASRADEGRRSLR